MKGSIGVRVVLLRSRRGVACAAVGRQASAALKSSVVCSNNTTTTTIKGTIGTTNAKFSGCTGGLGGSSTTTEPVSKLAGTVKTKIVWANRKGTTMVTQSFTALKTMGKCPKGTIYHSKVTGTTGASTGAAAKIIKVGEAVSGTFCTKQLTKTKLLTSLEPGTKYTL